MIDRVLSLSVQARWLVVFLTAVVAAYGLYEVNRLPIDALPDITNKQVQINFVAPTLGPEEVEKRVTFPDRNRSRRTGGCRKHALVFAQWLWPGDGDLRGKHESLLHAPAGGRAAGAGQTKSASRRRAADSDLFRPGLGEIFMYTRGICQSRPARESNVRDGEPGWQSDGSYLTTDGERLTDEVARLAYLRTVQDWIIRPQLRAVPGVADIDSLGGYEKQYVVEPDPTKLSAYGISYSDIAKALEQANLSVGANYIQSVRRGISGPRGCTHPFDR